ncbi:hypothetical protein PAMA_004615 [Pampus argenteus]
MPPVLTTSSMNYDYDYDTVQPCFFLQDEDFYPPPRSQLLPGPSEDIWKKFELLETPPRSPRHTPSLSDVPLSATEHLEAVSDLLGEDRSPSEAFLQSFIIQDCMWSSSFAAATKLEKVVSERLASLRARRDSSVITNNNNNSVADVLQDFHTAATDCIDPSVVFPYTALSEKICDAATMEVQSEVRLDSPPLSSSDSESEEEEEEEGQQEEEEEEEEEQEEEEGDEEIDVVTVDRRKVLRQCGVRSRPDASRLVLKRSHINIHQHNYAAQQPSATHKQPAGKRIKSESALRQSGGHRCWSPAPDDDDKRRTHNVLERQRRIELKMSFLLLRDQIPALANNEKAAKVVILKKATEFITEIQEEEKRLRAMKDELRKRSRELRHRLEQLRTSH